MAASPVEFLYPSNIDLSYSKFVRNLIYLTFLFFSQRLVMISCVLSSLLDVAALPSFCAVSVSAPPSLGIGVKYLLLNVRSNSNTFLPLHSVLHFPA